MLKGKTAVLGVTGSIAAYKMANVASMLVKMNADVHVLMTKNAANFINPITFETLTNNKCIIDTFDRGFEFQAGHVSLAKKADVFLVAPASADIIGKMACGIADDMLTTTLLAARCPVIVSPAMNTAMLENPAVKANIKKLADYGYIIIPPGDGRLACGTNGPGKLPSEDILVGYVLKCIAKEKDFAGKKVLVTSGPTIEPIDPVRYVTNHSTGKMGCAIARMAMLRGANVTLVTGPASAPPPMFCDIVNVNTAEEMYRAVMDRYADCDVIIKAAAVADYRPSKTSREKIKKDGEGSRAILELERTKDILAELGKLKKDGQILCGFSMETENVIENSRKKLVKKNADIIAANSLREPGAGFGGDTNRLALITKNMVKELPLMSKDEAADALLDFILHMSRQPG